MSSWNFMLSWVEHEKRFIILGPDFIGKYTIANTVKPDPNRHSKIDKTKVLKTNNRLKQVKHIAECSKIMNQLSLNADQKYCKMLPWSILQYFWPALSENWSWKPIFRLFESGLLTQVLLHSKILFYCFMYFCIKP